jgi:hypothetical protein
MNQALSGGPTGDPGAQTVLTGQPVGGASGNTAVARQAVPGRIPDDQLLALLQSQSDLSASVIDIFRFTGLKDLESSCPQSFLLVRDRMNARVGAATVAGLYANDARITRLLSWNAAAAAKLAEFQAYYRGTKQEAAERYGSAVVGEYEWTYADLAGLYADSGEFGLQLRELMAQGKPEEAVGLFIAEADARQAEEIRLERLAVEAEPWTHRAGGDRHGDHARGAGHRGGVRVGPHVGRHVQAGSQGRVPTGHARAGGVGAHLGVHRPGPDRAGRRGFRRRRAVGRPPVQGGGPPDVAAVLNSGERDLSAIARQLDMPERTLARQLETLTGAPREQLLARIRGAMGLKLAGYAHSPKLKWVPNRAASLIEWEEFYNRFEQIPVRLSSGILRSDEAIVAVIGHEMYELNKLREISAANGGVMRADDLHRAITPGRSGNLHVQAWDEADKLVLDLRKRRGGASPPGAGDAGGNAGGTGP